VSDEPACYSPDRKPPTARKVRAVDQLLWEIYLERDHTFWRAELFDENPHAWDVRIFRDGTARLEKESLRMLLGSILLACNGEARR
jgi:hypothetical protein